MLKKEKQLVGLFLSMLFIFFLAACSGSSGSNGTTDGSTDEIADTTTDDTTDGTADGVTDDTADDTTDDTTQSQVDDKELSDIQWESMGGPNGGDILFVGQDPYHLDDLYCSTARGLYISENQGDSWTLLEEIETKGIWNVGFSKNRIFACGEGELYYYDNAAGIAAKIPDTCLRAFADENSVFSTLGMQVDGTVSIKYSSADSDTFIWTDISPSATDLETLFDPYKTNGEFTGWAYVPHLFSFPSHMMISVAVTPSDGTDIWIDAKLFSSQDNGGTWSPVTISIPEGTVIHRITQDPDDPKHLMMTLRLCNASTDQCLPPDDPTMIGDFLRVSHDGGLTWQPLIKTVLSTYAFSADTLSFADGVYYLTGLNDEGFITLSGENYDQIDELGYPNVTDFGSFGIKDLFYDLSDGVTIYGYDGTNGVIRSDDGMETWNLVVEGIVAGAMANITLHPTDTNIIATSNIGMYMAQITSDGGTTWEPLKDSATYADELVFDMHNPGRMLIIDEVTKIKESIDSGQNWQWILEDFNTARVSDFHVSDLSGGTILAAVIGEGIVRLRDLENFDWNKTNNSLDWTLLYKSPDYAYDVEPHPTDSSILYATYSPKKFEDFAIVYQYTENEAGGSADNYQWIELLKVNGTKGVTSISVDPTNPDNIYAGFTGDRGYIYESTNKGADWEVLNNTLTFATIHEMAIDPGDEKTAYAAPWGGGLYMTTDGGENWSEAKTPTTSIVSVLVDPDDSEHLYIGDRNKPAIYESLDQGETWSTLVSLDTDYYYRVFAMVLHNESLHFSVMDKVTGILALFQTPMSGSTFRLEADNSLTELGGEMNRVVLNFFSNGNALYAVSHIYGAFKLVGTAWENISDTTNETLPDIGMNSIFANENDIFVTGGSDLNVDLTHRIADSTTRNDVVRRIYKTSDGGVTWAPLPGAPFDTPVKRLLQHPENEQVLFAATFNGLWVSTDGGASWQAQNNRLDFKSIGSMALSENYIYAGTLGGGVYSGKIETDYSITWSSSVGPYPEIYNLQVRVDPTDSDTIYTTAYPGGVFKSKDRGTSWSEMNFGLPSFEVTDPAIQGYYSLEIDPYDNNILYLGIFGKGIYKSLDGGQTWAPQYGDFGQNRDIMKMEITRVVADPAIQDTFYLTSRKKGVWKTTNGTETWTEMNSGLDTYDVLSLQISEAGILYAGTDGYGIYYYDTYSGSWTHMGRTIGFGDWWPWERPTYQYSALMFDPDIPGRIYLGHFPSGFFISEDDGDSWKASNLGLGNDGIFSLTLDPENSQTIWAGTYNGVAKSVDAGTSWQMKSTGMPEQQWPFDIVIDDEDRNIMYVATKNGANKGFCDRNEFCGVVLKSIDGGENWEEIMTGLDDTDEFYSIVIHPEDHDIVFLSTSNGVYGSDDAGLTWQGMNSGLPTLKNQMRGNVGQTMKLSRDKKYLILGITLYGVWRADISL